MRHEASSFSIKTQTAEIVACQIVGPYLTSSLRFGMFRLPCNEKKVHMPLFKNLSIGLLLKTTSRQNSHVFSNSTNGTGTFLALALQCVCSCFFHGMNFAICQKCYRMGLSAQKVSGNCVSFSSDYSHDPITNCNNCSTSTQEWQW